MNEKKSLFPRNGIEKKYLKYFEQNADHYQSVLEFFRMQSKSKSVVSVSQIFEKESYHQ